MLIPKDCWPPEVAEEVNLLREELNRLTQAWEREVPNHVYHFTRSDTLKKILESRTFRLYNVFDMEDKEEFGYPLRTIRETLKSYWGPLRDISDAFNPLRCPALEDVLYLFAGCFCEVEESEFMWCRYGDCFRGASLKIHTPSFRPIYPMVYDEGQFVQVLAAFVEHIVSRDWTGRFEVLERRTVGFEAVMELVQLLARMKRVQFSAESEWRALEPFSRGDAFETDERGRHYSKIRLPPECVSAVILGSKSPLRETELRHCFGIGDPITVMRSELA